MTIRRIASALALSVLAVWLMTACATNSPAAPAPTAGSIQVVTPVAPRPATAAPPRKTVHLTILHTNDSRGYVDPCG